MAQASNGGIVLSAFGLIPSVRAVNTTGSQRAPFCAAYTYHLASSFDGPGDRYIQPTGPSPPSQRGHLLLVTDNLSFTILKKEIERKRGTGETGALHWVVPALGASDTGTQNLTMHLLPFSCLGWFLLSYRHFPTASVALAFSAHRCRPPPWQLLFSKNNSWTL